MTATPTRILRLADHRSMEFAEFGDPSGMPVLYFHGYMGSCHQAGLLHRHALKHGIRIIAANRPGVGKSSPHRFGVMTGYAGDIKELIDALGIDECAALGMSGGACFALACASAMPNRIRSVTTAGCLGPMNIPHVLAETQRSRRIFLSLCHFYPRITYRCLQGILAVCRLFPRALYRYLMYSSSVLETGVISLEGLKQILWQDYRSTFLEYDGARGMLDEARLYFRWGFSLRDFPPQTEVIFWHGTEDPIIPWATIAMFTRSIRRRRAILCDGGHLTYLAHLDDVLKTIKESWKNEHTHDSTISPVEDREYPIVIVSKDVPRLVPQLAFR